MRFHPFVRSLASTAVLAAAVLVASACTGPSTGVATTGTAGSAGSDGSAPGTSAPATGSVPPPMLVACGEHRTFAYATPPGVDPNLTSLDVYVPPAGAEGCRGRPIVVWVHGGGWTGGDK